MVRIRVFRLLLSPIQLVIRFFGIIQKIAIPSRQFGAGSPAGGSRRELDWGPASRYRPHRPIL